MTQGQGSSARGVAQVESLLAKSPARFFAALGELDWYAASHRKWIDDLVQTGDRVLEVGCATGALTAHLSDIGCLVSGIDRSRSMIRRARKDHPELDLVVGDATSLPYSVATFDTVVAASLVNVVPDPRSVLFEMSRVSRSGGTLSVLVPSTDFTDDDLDVLTEKLGLTGFSRAALAKWHGSATKMDRSHLEELFRIVRCESVMISSYLDGMLVAVSAIVRPD